MNHLLFEAWKNGNGGPVLDGKGDHAARPEVDLFEIMAARVRAGENIHFTGPVDGPLGQAHLSTINRLRIETGLPVRVIYS